MKKGLNYWHEISIPERGGPLSSAAYYDELAEKGEVTSGKPRGIFLPIWEDLEGPDRVILLIHLLAVLVPM